MVRNDYMDTTVCRRRHASSIIAEGTGSLEIVSAVEARMESKRENTYTSTNPATSLARISSSVGPLVTGFSFSLPIAAGNWVFSGIGVSIASKVFNSPEPDCEGSILTGLVSEILGAEPIGRAEEGAIFSGHQQFR